MPGKSVPPILHWMHKTWGRWIILGIWNSGLDLDHYKFKTKDLKKMNTDLKQIAIIAGIDPDLFTTYSASHTYAMCLRRGGVGMEIISQALGDSDFATTKHYLESFENDVIDKADEILIKF